MASRFLLILLAYTLFGTLAYASTLPVNIALDQPIGTIYQVAPINASGPQNVSPLNNTIIFYIPGTQTSLVFSRFTKVISQTELDLCVIEGIGYLFGAVLAKGGDGFLPLNRVEYKYGNVVINVHDFAAPSFRMTYASVVSTLRGIALFTSMYGYFGMAFEVYDGKKGHVGTGDFGGIIPV
ncbi:hypothetical protein HO173_000631 [Letharia columbiana]|uniref:Uncharacterized protein n=1 Tax=Letharia columbiana TaxID=112416 RepID=A0A8H6G5A3_9LECA|nr:uncharacterized protein HO173_000631 [Letharia columbiana]KAF6240839.1 hypothetical protein HO173_000631 [Letharia columbiana]